MGNQLTSFVYTQDKTDSNNEVNETVDKFTDDTIPQVTNNLHTNLKYKQRLDTIFEDGENTSNTEGVEDTDNTDNIVNVEKTINDTNGKTDTQTNDEKHFENIDNRNILESQKYFIRKYNIDNIDIDISDEEIIDTLSIPDDDRYDNSLFTSLEEITLLKRTIINLEQELSNKCNEITLLKNNYIKLKKNKNNEIKKLIKKMDDYNDEYDELYLDNLRLKRKYKSKICEIFTPLNYTNIDYNSDSNYLTI